MASFRVYKKLDGMISITAVIRRKGISFSETFTAKTKSKAMIEARAWASRVEEDIYLKKKNNPSAAKQRLGDFFDAYFNHIRLAKRKRESTITEEEYSRTQLERLLGKTTYLTDITTSTIAAYRDKRIADGIGASKIRLEIALVSCLFKYAIQEKGFNIENPVGAGKLWRPKAPRGKTDFLAADEIRMFLSKCRESSNKKLAAFVAVLINTGMRPGEVAALKVGDIDQGRRTIRLERTKNDAARTIPLTETAYREIMPHVTGRHMDEYVFHRGKTLPPIYQKRPAALFREAFDRAKVAAGLTITQHGLRHTAATHMMEAGVHIRTIAAVLGHKTLQMAMRYTHPDEAELRKAVDTLDRLVS